MNSLSDLNRFIAIGWECLVDMAYYCATVEIEPEGKLHWQKEKVKDFGVLTPIFDVSPKLDRSISLADLKRSGCQAFAEGHEDFCHLSGFCPIKNFDLNTLVLHFNVEWLPPDPASPDAIEFLLQEAKRCLTQAHRTHVALIHVQYALALLGYVYHAVRLTSQCALCPARSESGSKYCTNHKQIYNFEAGRSRAQALRNHRIGLRAKKMARLLGIQSMTEKYAGSDHLEAVCEVAERWLPSPASLYKASRYADIIEALNASPLVLQKLGGRKALSLDYASLGTLIYQRLMPAHKYRLNLDIAVRDFETWLQLECKASQKNAYSDEVLLQKVERATALANSGKKAFEIADEFKVARSTVSMWKNKFEFFRVALVSINAK